MDKFPMTHTGYAALQQELQHLKENERPAIIKAIAEAREHGDLKENAEYHAARDRQSFVEGRVLELEAKISRAEVVDPAKMSGDTIKFSATVTLIDDDTEKESTYQLVGAEEADISRGLISIASPLGRALIGKKVGDAVEVITPGGGKGYEVVKIVYT